MKKPVRNIHIDGQEWHYIMGNGCAKVFPPHSKSCMAMVWYDDAPEDVPDKADAWSSEVGYRPGRLKAIVPAGSRLSSKKNLSRGFQHGSKRADPYWTLQS